MPTVRQAMAQSGLVPVDANALLAHVLQRDRAWLVAHAEDALTREAADAFFALAKRRRDGEPIAYLTGVREFWGLTLRVNPAVLIPRPETETLVETALERLAVDRDSRVLDLGTGSGAVALAIAHDRPRARVLASDVSGAAIEVARRNAESLGIGNVEFVVSDWYASVPMEFHDAAFDVIAANPPYVAARDPHLTEGDLRFEPAQALSPGGDGMSAIRNIIAGARERLASGGTLAVEHGYDQSEAVRALFVEAGLTEIGAARDLAGIPRVAFGRTS